MQKSCFETFTYMLINFNISFFSVFILVLKAFFTFFINIIYRDDEEFYTYVLKSN